MTEVKKKAIKEWLKNALGYVVPCVIGASIFVFVLKIAVVSGNSMNDTYFNGDILLCLRTSNLERGDIVVCDCNAGVTLIKRVIGVEGDVIDIDFSSGAVTLNGEILQENYIKEPTLTDEGGHTFPITVPKDSYFVMGDNRNASTDSRDAKVGYITKEQVQGKVIYKIA